jgi:hypothetical protein
MELELKVAYGRSEKYRPILRTIHWTTCKSLGVSRDLFVWQGICPKGRIVRVTKHVIYGNCPIEPEYYVQIMEPV